MYKYDAIVVLAGGIQQNGELSITSKERTDAGIKAFKEGLSSHLTFSGSWSFLLQEKPPITEAAAMENYAVLQNIPEENIFKEEKSKDTLGNAYFVKTEYLIPQNWHHVLVITSDFHLSRTKYIFDHILGSNFQIDYQGVSTHLSVDTDGEQKMLALTKEWLEPVPTGDDTSVQKLLFNMHPAYAPNSPITLADIRKKLETL